MGLGDWNYAANSNIGVAQGTQHSLSGALVRRHSNGPFVSRKFIKWKTFAPNFEQIRTISIRSDFRGHDAGTVSDDNYHPGVFLKCATPSNGFVGNIDSSLNNTYKFYYEHNNVNSVTAVTGYGKLLFATPNETFTYAFNVDYNIQDIDSSFSPYIMINTWISLRMDIAPIFNASANGARNNLNNIIADRVTLYIGNQSNTNELTKWKLFKSYILETGQGFIPWSNTISYGYMASKASSNDGAMYADNTKFFTYPL